MTIRTRKLIGAFGLLLLVTVWSLLAMALAQSVLTDINGLVAAFYYVVAGLGSFVMGAGLGVLNTTFIVSIQTSVAWSQRGVATASNMLTGYLGATGLWTTLWFAQLTVAARETRAAGRQDAS